MQHVVFFFSPSFVFDVYVDRSNTHGFLCLGHSQLVPSSQKGWHVMGEIILPGNERYK